MIGKDRPAWRTTSPMAVMGTGWAVPGEAVSSDDLIDRIERRFGFARAATARLLAAQMGIKSRHISRTFAERAECPLPAASNPQVTAEAVRRALDDAGVALADVSYLIAHTSTPETQLPPNVAYVADLLGYDGPYVELRQACTGFANGLMIASGLLAAGVCGPVVIAGSETGSLFVDPGTLDDHPDQIVNLIQMGDGAGAIVLGPGPSPASGLITSAWFGTIGRDISPGILLGNGDRHFSHAFARIAQTGPTLFRACLTGLEALGLHPAELDVLVPHQVSGRIGEQLAEHLQISPERLFVNADRLGNTGSAAMWIALAQLRETGLKPGTRVAALGAEASKYMYGGFVYEQG